MRNARDKRGQVFFGFYIFQQPRKVVILLGGVYKIVHRNLAGGRF